MQAFAADLNLAFETRKIVLVEVAKLPFPTQHNQSLDGLGQQKLMVEWHVCSSILQGKNNPDPHCLLFWGKKILVNQTPLLKILNSAES